MEATKPRTLTAAEFAAIALLPENRHRRLELIGGEIVEVVSNQTSSAIALEIGMLIRLYARQHNPGFVTGADGGFVIGDEHYMPDVAFVSKQNRAVPGPEGYAPRPDLAVEVLSPGNSPEEIAAKVHNYTLHDVVTWIVSPTAHKVTVYERGKPAVTFRRGDDVPGDPVLPGLKIAVNDIFAVLAADDGEPNTPEASTDIESA